MTDELYHMGQLVIEDAGLPRDTDDVELAEEVFKLKNQKDEWAVIDKLLEAWAKKAPENVDALEIEIEDHRENLTDKEFGQTAGGKDFERRFKMMFPKQLLLMIRTIYRPDELEFDRDFQRKFAKRYPFFRVAEKD